MTTPTREQVIEWADQAGITSDDAACQIHDLMRLCAFAMSAGRDQGLREAKEVLLRTPHDADVFAAIEQMRGG